MIVSGVMMAHSSIGQDARFSFLKEQFDSAMGYEVATSSVATFLFGRVWRVQSGGNSYLPNKSNRAISIHRKIDWFLFLQQFLSEYNKNKKGEVAPLAFNLIIFNRSRINCVRLPLYESLLRYGQCKYPVLYPYFNKNYFSIY